MAEDWRVTEGTIYLVPNHELIRSSLLEERVTIRVKDL